MVVILSNILTIGHIINVILINTDDVIKRIYITWQDGHIRKTINLSETE